MGRSTTAAGGVRVTHEWAPLREVVVGRPFYRIAEPFPETLRQGIGGEAWQRIKDAEGRTLGRAFPQLQARLHDHMEGAVRLLRQRGIKVHVMPAFRRAEEPDVASGGVGGLQCFPRDLLLVIDDHLIELSLAKRYRRRELFPLRRLLDDVLDGRTVRRSRMPQSISRREIPPGSPLLEGGDCLMLEREVLVGVSGRASNSAGIRWLQHRLGRGWRVTPVRLAAEVPHLDMALCLVRPGLGIRWPWALPDGLPASLRGWRWIDITRREALHQLAANCLPLDVRTVLVPAEAGRVARALAQCGQEVLVTPFAGVAWLHGGLRCWSQPLVRVE